MRASSMRKWSYLHAADIAFIKIKFAKKALCPSGQIFQGGLRAYGLIASWLSVEIRFRCRAQAVRQASCLLAENLRAE